MLARVLYSVIIALTLVCVHAAPIASPTTELNDSDALAQLGKRDQIVPLIEAQIKTVTQLQGTDLIYDWLTGKSVEES